MFGQIEQLKHRLEEMLASNDAEWVSAVKLTLNALYRQFQLEKNGRRILAPGTRRIPQIALCCRRRYQI